MPPLLGPRDLPEGMLEAKARLWAQLRDRPDITGIGIGWRTRHGVTIEEPVLKVLVGRKIAEPDEPLPRSFMGFAVDVEEANPRPGADDSAYDPVEGGVSIGPRSVASIGTMGVVVLDTDTQAAMLLSAGHVFSTNTGDALVPVGTQAVQPGGGSNVLGTLLRRAYGAQDYAVVEPNGTRQASDSILGVGATRGALAASEIAVGLVVRKRGRTTGLTYGTVSAIHVTINVDGADCEFFRIDRDASRNATWGQPGDSGAAVVDAYGRVAGMHTRGSEDNTQGFAQYMTDVQAAAGVVVPGDPSSIPSGAATRPRGRGGVLLVGGSGSSLRYLWTPGQARQEADGGVWTGSKVEGLFGPFTLRRFGNIGPGRVVLIPDDGGPDAGYVYATDFGMIRSNDPSREGTWQAGGPFGLGGFCPYDETHHIVVGGMNRIIAKVRRSDMVEEGLTPAFGEFDAVARYTYGTACYTHTDGDLYVSGGMDEFRDSPSDPYVGGFAHLARWDGSSWHHLGLAGGPLGSVDLAGVAGNVISMAGDTNGHIIMGGNFGLVGSAYDVGWWTRMNSVMRYEPSTNLRRAIPDGGVDAGVRGRAPGGANGDEGFIRKVALAPDGSVWIVGQFELAAGDDGGMYPALAVARWNGVATDGWHEVGGGIPCNWNLVPFTFGETAGGMLDDVFFDGEWAYLTGVGHVVDEDGVPIVNPGPVPFSPPNDGWYYQMAWRIRWASWDTDTLECIAIGRDENNLGNPQFDVALFGTGGVRGGQAPQVRKVQRNDHPARITVGRSVPTSEQRSMRQGGRNTYR